MTPQEDIYVMISYEHKSGTKYKERLSEELCNDNIKVWVNTEQMHGYLYECMAKAIASAKLMVVLLSEGYAQSENCNELTHAQKCGTRLLFVKVEKYNPPLSSEISLIMKDSIYYKVYGQFDDTAKIITAIKKFCQAADPNQTITYAEMDAKRTCSKNTSASSTDCASADRSSKPTQETDNNIEPRNSHNEGTVVDDDKPLDSYDVILSYDLNSGMHCKNELYNSLTEQGLSVCDVNDEKLCNHPEIWTDRMAASSVVILLLSKDYSMSQDCKGRLENAIRAGKLVLPVMIERFKPIEESLLGQFIKNVVSYELYKRHDENVKRIVRAVEEHLNKTGVAEGSRGPPEDGKNSMGSSERCDQPDVAIKKSETTYINIYGGYVAVGSNTHMNISGAVDPNQTITYAGMDAKRTRSKNTSASSTESLDIGKGVRVSSKHAPTKNKSSSSSINVLTRENVLGQADRSIDTDVSLSPDELYSRGLERSVGDLNEECLEELALKLGNQSGVVANWATVARALNMDMAIINKIEQKGTAHRLLFKAIRDKHPRKKLSDIKDILENKMHRKPRKDIFYDYEQKTGLPALDRELGHLSKGEFESVLENVADKLATEPIRGHWRNVGSHLGFKPCDLDDFMNEGRPDNFHRSARVFIDYLARTCLPVKDLVTALTADNVKRVDLGNFIKESLMADDCWIRG